MFEKIFKEETRSNLPLPTPNCSLEIISTSEQLDRLISAGYDFSTCPYLEYLKNSLNRGINILLLFIDREFSHYSCMALNNKDPLFKRIDDQDTGFIGPCYTTPNHRGKGIYPFALSKVCEFFKERKKSRALICTKTKNLPSIKGIKKAGFLPNAEVRYIRLLFWNFPREFELKKAPKDIKTALDI